MKRVFLSICIALLANGCKKQATNPPDEGKVATPPSSTEQPKVVQEPDPPEIASSRSLYLLGNYTQVVNNLQPLLDELKQNNKHRAAGLAAGWLALALVHDVAENAEEPAKFALSMAEQTGDAEVKSVAKIAYGAYLLGVEDFAQAASAFSEAVAVHQDGPNAALAFTLQGDAKIGLAFAGEEKITKPEELDGAITSYGKARSLAESPSANSQQEKDVMLARALEGLASAARYQGKNAETCAQVGEVIRLYENAGAAEYIIEGAIQLQQQANCK